MIAEAFKGKRGTRGFKKGMREGMGKCSRVGFDTPSEAFSRYDTCITGLPFIPGIKNRETGKNP